MLIALVAITLANIYPLSVQASDFGASVWARYFRDVLVKAAAQAAWKNLSNRVVQKIQSGGIGGVDGKTLFVQDWRDFQLKAQSRGEDIWRGLLYVAANGEDNTPPLLCDYIRNSQTFKTLRPKEIPNLIKSGLNRKVDNLQDYLTRTECDTLINKNYDLFIKDFSQGGGWDTWEKLLQPQNNIYGAMAMAFDELEKQRKIQETAAVNEARSGSGFIGLKDCLSRTKGTNVCALLGKIITPGSIFKDSTIEATTGGAKALLAGADGASIAVAALVNFALNRVFDLAGSSQEGENVSITSEKRTHESYKQEFCTADDNISKEAAFYIRDNYPKVFGPIDFDLRKNFIEIEGMGSTSFPLEHNKCDGGNDICGKSYCKWSTKRYKSENTYPFSRCVQACLKAVGEGESLAAPLFTPPPELPPEEEPLPTPTPTPTPTGGQPTSLLSDVQAERAKYPPGILTDEQRAKILNAVAWKNKDLGWGLLSKPSGTNCFFVSGPIACDILFHKPSGLHFDALTDFDATWIPKGLIDISRWLTPVQP